MSKRAMLWLVGLVAFGFTYIAAVNITETSVTSFFGSTHISTTCKGMWMPGAWFDDYCSDSLPSRLGVLALGLAALIVCGYFAEKGMGHVAKLDHGSRVYKCSEPGCGFTTKSFAATFGHKRPAEGATPARLGMSASRQTSGPAASKIVYPSRVPPAPAVTPAATPEFKTCPDCAEEVRFAARKCRFCGYMFEPADVPS